MTKAEVRIFAQHLALQYQAALPDAERERRWKAAERSDEEYLRSMDDVVRLMEGMIVLAHGRARGRGGKGG
jgi:hypothetical protein